MTNAMQIKLSLLGLAAISGIASSIAANVIIRKQDELIEEYRDFTNTLIDVVAVFEQYAPTNVQVSVREHLAFEDIARRLSK